MSQIHKHSIPANIAERCLINPEQYEAQYQQSVTDPDTFWGEQGKILDWIKPYTRVKNTSFAPGTKTAPLTWPLTVSIAIWRSAATRRPSSGKATTPARAKISLIANSTVMSAALPMSCSTSALKRAMSWLSICRWCRKPRWPCWPAPASALSIR